MRTSAWSWWTVGTVSAGIGWTRTPLSASTRHPRSTAWPRRCSARGASSRTGRRPACTSERRRRRSAPTTPGCCASGCSGREGVLLPELRLPRRGPVRVAPVRASGTRFAAGDASSTPATSRPEIPATTPAPFGVADGAHVVAVNELVKLGGAPSQYVIVGSGKTATDACIWLLDNGVDPGAICWVRPRDPWMLNRAVVQPDPAVFIGMAADTMQAAAEAASPDDLFLRLEDARGDAAHRPVRDSHHGEDSDARSVGTRPIAHDRARRPARAHPARRADPVGVRARARLPRRRTP